MSESKRDYFVPEQLDDNDFEKEKLEEKRAKKEKKFELNKKQILRIFSIMLVIVLVLGGIYLYLNPVEKKASAPEEFVKDFCAYFNAGNWKKIDKLIDFKAYYILGGVLEEKNYTQFDKTYRKFSENDEDYLKFQKTIEILTSIDADDLKDFANIQINLKSIEACNLIQKTDTLYKLRVNFDYIYEGQSQNLTGILFVSNASGDYKMVYGEWLQTVMNYYQSVYAFQSQYGY